MRFEVALFPSEEGYAVCATKLPGCWSQGDSEQDALASIADAIREYLAAAAELNLAPANGACPEHFDLATDLAEGAQLREVEVEM